MSVSERAKALQIDSDVKIRTLARHLEIGEHTLGTYLNGKHTMPYDVMVRFADYYHVTTDYLLGRTDTPEEPFPVSTGERALLASFRSLSREQKELIVQNIRLMCRQNEQK